MLKADRVRGFLSRRGAALALLLVLAGGAVCYAWGAPVNPPGFFIDESSVAYNAHLVATTGRDEHGVLFPTYFLAFGDCKNPTYVYLLAAVFRLTGPGIAPARYLSAALGVSAAFVLALLGAELTGRRGVGVLTALTALLTPWLFQLSRVVVEVAMYPLVVALLLLCLHRASRKAAWRLSDALCVAAALALVTYTYSTGRLFGPLLALGLVLFASRRERLRSVLLTWALYALSLVPLVVFNLRHPGALTERFGYITYITPQTTYAEDARRFVEHYFRNLSPWRMVVTGDPNAYQLASIEGAPLVLAATFALAALGALLVFKHQRRDAWWRYFFYALAASVVPASLTNEYFHSLRLSPVPVFVFALAAPALAWLSEGGRARRAALVSLVVLTLAQGALFRRQYAESAAWPLRLHIYDSDYARVILTTALAQGSRPIYLSDANGVPGYIQAFWYSTLRGVPLSDFKRIAADDKPPSGALVITTKDVCVNCRVIAESAPYTLYYADTPARPHAPLPEGAFRARVEAPDAPLTMRAGKQATLRVLVRNEGDAVWPGRDWSADALQVELGNHWLDASAAREVAHDDGRAPLVGDLAPGGEREFRLTVNAPKEPGDYVLEIDMVQEGVSWFALKGSSPARLRVKVESGWLD